MKKTLSLILATVLLFAMALPAAADTTLTINYIAPNRDYTLTFPASQSIEDGKLCNIGMVNISTTGDFRRYHVTVECQISQFVGREFGEHYPAYLAYHVNGDTSTYPDGSLVVYGNGHSVIYAEDNTTVAQQAQPVTLNFYDVVKGETEDEYPLADKAWSVDDTQYDDGQGGHVAYVDSLWAHTYIIGNAGHTDTYEATITYTASCEFNG